jgi:hypothetical protein
MSVRGEPGAKIYWQKNYYDRDAVVFGDSRERLFETTPDAILEG